MAKYDLRDYLAQDLLFFGTIRVDWGSGAPPNTNQLAALLTSTIHQPYDQLILEERLAIAQRPVHQARIAVEILRRYLAPLSVDTANADRAYLQSAYEIMLGNLGTSFDELRVVRSADDDDIEQARRDLAVRLGFDSVGRLDELFLRPDEITEEQLASLFGLESTTGDAFNPSPTSPAALKWRADLLRSVWMGASEDASSDAVPAIDPDLVTEDMVADPAAGDELVDSDLLKPAIRGAALALLSDRAQVVGGFETTIQATLDKAIADEDTLLAAYDRVIASVLGPVDLEQALIDRTEGTLGSEQDDGLELLDIAALRRLVRLRKLAGSGVLTQSEQADLVAIFVQVQKRQRFADWKEEELEAGIFLTPDIFRLPAGATRRPLRQWRATHRQRREWESTLQSRVDQLGNTIQGLNDAVAATEHVVLRQLRDALVAALAEVLDDTDAVAAADRLTNRLLFDFRDLTDDRRSRLEQGVATMQGLLFALRMGRSIDQGFPEDGAVAKWRLRPDIPESDFDLEWLWLGSYAMRNSVEQVTRHPESYLLASLRDDGVAPQQRPTPAFRKLIEGLRASDPLTRAGARRLAETYLQSWKTLDETVIDLIEKRLEEVTGNASVTFALTEELQAPDLVVRKALVERLFDEQAIAREYTTDEGTVIKIDDPHLAPNWLQEIFYFVPMAIAQQFTQAGEFLAALDWYETVFAYSLAPERRRIYRGLELEGVFGDQRRIEKQKWLRQQLNPHGFARQRKHAYTRFVMLSIAQTLLDYGDSEFTAETSESLARARELFLAARDVITSPEMPTGHPVVEALRRHGELQLDKLRSGRNIAGMERPPSHRTVALAGAPQLSVFSGRIGGAAQPVFPTPYRYSALIQRAKELVGIAQQMEQSYLASLERRDAEAYTLLQASHDLRLTRARLEVQHLRVSEAQTSVTLAELQHGRAQIQSETFQGFIDGGFSDWEHELTKHYAEARDARVEAARLQFVANAVSGAFNIESLPGIVGLAASSTIGGQALQASIDAIRAEAGAQIAAVNASHERRMDEWRLQKSLAAKDVEIGTQQIALAENQKQIMEAEERIAGQQASYAEESVSFLSNKFTNVDLYEWMSGVLGRVYSYFLQQATAMAQLAEKQLAFERQEPTPGIIRTDYWQSSSGSVNGRAGNAGAPDRRGLTGSARLLEDVHRLDLFAFETNRRRLQLSQTFSLSQLFPFEFQRLRGTGVMTFATPLELFDREFPGHYLRLIKRVNVSVIALLPPTHGVRATLTASGVSRVVTAGPPFQVIDVRREPELIAFTTPIAATGVFVDGPDEGMLLPFEGRGVDTLWQLQLPQPANPFDFRTLADVLLTVDYTALHSEDYRQQVIERLDGRVSRERSFSFRHQFPDAFYDLHTPPQPDAARVARFATRRDDFPPHLVADPTIAHVLLFVVRAPGATFKVRIERLLFKEVGSSDTDLGVGGGATTVDGIVSTRRSSGAAWVPIQGRRAIGLWELVLAATDDGTEEGDPIEDRLKNGEIEDLLLVIGYHGEVAGWPA